jgi:DNA-binding MarR family transcriptional regulator
MRLEEAIKSHFRNDQHKALLNIYYTNSVLQTHYKNLMRPFDLTPQQFNVLRILKGQYPEAVRIGLVKGRMIDRNSDMTRLVKRLVQKGLIERINCPVDKRQFDLKITEKGMEVLDKLSLAVASFEDNLKGLSKEELEQLNSLMEKFRKHLPALEEG